MIPTTFPNFSSTRRCEHDFAGRRIFQHRLRKWRFTQENVSIPGFLYEEECRAALNELRGNWTGGFPVPRV